MTTDQNTPESKVTPTDTVAVPTGRRWRLSNIWSNTKPSYPTGIRLMFFAFQILIVIIGFIAGKEVVGLNDPWSAPLLNFVCVGFGIFELISLISAMQKPHQPE